MLRVYWDYFSASYITAVCAPNTKTRDLQEKKCYQNCPISKTSPKSVLLAAERCFLGTASLSPSAHTPALPDTNKNRPVLAASFSISHSTASPSARHFPLCSPLQGLILTATAVGTLEQPWHGVRLQFATPDPDAGNDNRPRGQRQGPAEGQHSLPCSFSSSTIPPARGRGKVHAALRVKAGKAVRRKRDPLQVPVRTHRPGTGRDGTAPPHLPCERRASRPPSAWERPRRLLVNGPIRARLPGILTQ